MFSLARTSPAAIERVVLGSERIVHGKLHGVVRQHIAVAGQQVPALAGSQLQRTRGVGSVDHRSVDEGGDVVDLLPRVFLVGSGRRVENRTRQPDRLVSGAVEVEPFVAERHGHGERLGAAGGRQIHVVIDELTPGVDHGRHAAIVDLVVRLRDDRIADLARAGPIGARGGQNAVAVFGRRFAQQVDARATPLRVQGVVVGAVDRANGGRQHLPLFEGFEPGPAIQSRSCAAQPCARDGFLAAWKRNEGAQSWHASSKKGGRGRAVRGVPDAQRRTNGRQIR